MTMTRSRTIQAVVSAVFLGVSAASAHAQLVEDRTKDKVAFPAHRIVDNLYYVGTAMLNSYLITTPQGHILINTNFEDTVPLLRASIEQLGFKLTDIKIILGSHAHGDHMQGDAAVKSLTGGAQVMAMEQDVPALKNMMVGTTPHPVDRVLKDGELVAHGGTTLTARLTPGHTRGCTTWTMKVTDGGKPRDVVITCGGLQDGARLVNNKNYPEIADDFARSITVYRSLPVDYFLSSHSWFFDLAGKHAKLGASPNPYLDAAGYTRFVDAMERDLTTMLAEQRKNPPAN
jgi:metallo-beta-lactamase class B